MEYIEDFSDARLKGWCIHCHRSQGSTPFTLDHIPSKSLLDKPLPANTPKVAICSDCNNQLSMNEEYLAVFLRCVLENTAEPSELKHGPTGRALNRNSRLAYEMRMACSQLELFPDNHLKNWKPDLERIMPPLLKNARGHFIYELGEAPEGEPSSTMAVASHTLTGPQRRYFETLPQPEIFSEVGSRMMFRIMSGVGLNAQGWVEVQNGTYRYAVIKHRCVRMVLREYLAFEAIWSP